MYTDSLLPLLWMYMWLWMLSTWCLIPCVFIFLSETWQIKTQWLVDYTEHSPQQITPPLQPPPPPTNINNNNQPTKQNPPPPPGVTAFCHVKIQNQCWMSEQLRAKKSSMVLNDTQHGTCTAHTARWATESWIWLVLLGSPCKLLRSAAERQAACTAELENQVCTRRGDGILI